MYLLHTSTFMLRYFESSDIPDYAILSHTWDEEEVSFQDVQDGRGQEMARFQKIRGCCKQATSDGWEYVWIDTCCIDKSSSADLSEAINSMYRWYEGAQVCYAYLSDIPGDDTNPLISSSHFWSSRWFTRGWTLQELLAPGIVMFFNHHWIEIGTKASLYDIITSITDIRPLVGFQEACVARKISWASRRQTKRVEDRAYCLMGLLGVNMPPLYGEGENAFQRLQLELLNRSDDESIFAWEEDRSGWSDTYTPKYGGGLLASSPDAFRNSGDVEEIGNKTNRAPFSMTNKGLRIELFLKSVGNNKYVFLAPLTCRRQDSPNCLAVRLWRKDGDRFLRVGESLEVCEWIEADRGRSMEVIYVEQIEARNPSILYRTEVLINPPSQLEHSFSVSNIYLPERNRFLWKSSRDDGLRLISEIPWLELHAAAGIAFSDKAMNRFILILRVHPESGPWIILLPRMKGQSLGEMVDNCINGPVPEPNFRLDRFSIALSTNLFVSAALKRKSEGGKSLFVVDTTIKTTATT